MFDRCVIDASMGYPFCFCPIEGDLNGEYSIVTGLNILADKLPHEGKLVAIVHPDGQGAVDKFYDEHKAEIDHLLGKG